jgi:hypothetical protein
MSILVLAFACVAFAIVVSRLMRENAVLKERVKRLQQGKGPNRVESTAGKNQAQDPSVLLTR